MSSKINLSALSFDELKKLINDAQKEIQRKKRAEIRSVRQQIEKLASGVDMTLDEVLAFDKRKASATVGEPKYRNPDNPEETWTGRGKRPKWFANAEKKGISREDMEIQ